MRIRGVEHGQCRKCGKTYEFVPRFPHLLRTTALELAKTLGRLTPKEIRFLRDVLGAMSKEILSRELGEDKRWVRWAGGRRHPLDQRPQAAGYNSFARSR